MKASIKWLERLTGQSLDVVDVAHKLTFAGLEVEATETVGRGLESVQVVEVVSVERHPHKDKLNLVTINLGNERQTVVCGAPNVPAAGGRVLFVPPGATLPNGVTLGTREIAGVQSSGMLASEAELGIGSDGDGIVVLGDKDPGRPGDLVSVHYDLCDSILEINVTPNRPDALGHLGLARELCALYGWDLPQPSRSKAIASLKTLEVPVTVSASALCSEYLAIELDGLTVAPSPLAIRLALFRVGGRAINNVVDATNYVLFETGHPTHVFDLSRVADGIDVRLAKADESITTLDGVARELSGADLVIATTGGEPVALAGVMGGKDSGVTESTRRGLLEVAWFEPKAVRRTAKRHGIHSDASHRFERGCDHGALLDVAERLINLLAANCGATAVSAGRGLGESQPSVKVVYRPERFRRLIGTTVSADESAMLLTRLGCRPVLTDTGLMVEVPTYRPDLRREEDLIEEVLRLKGYDTVPPVMALLGTRAAARPDPVRLVRQQLVALGFSEALNFSFVDPRTERPDAVRLINPLSEDRSVMRTELLTGLLESVVRGEKFQLRDARLFEVARVFEPDHSADTGVREELHLALVMSGFAVEDIHGKNDVDFFDLKGVLEGLFGTMLRFVQGEQLRLHPRATAILKVGETTVGYAGELHPDLRDRLELRRRPMVCELNLGRVLTLLAPYAGKGQMGTAPPSVPTVQRDLACVVPLTTLAFELVAAAKSAGEALLLDVDVFDAFQLADGSKKSVGLRFTFGAHDRTLKDAEVDSATARLAAVISKLMGT